MAKAKEILAQKILEILAKEPDGLEVGEIIERLGAGVSKRGVRNLLNQLVEENRLIKKRKEGQEGRGTPPYIYFHKNKENLLSKSEIPRQLTIFDYIFDIEKYTIQTKPEIEKNELDPAEKERQNEARSVLQRIAASHLRSEAYAKALIDIAHKLAEKNPVDLVVEMATWVVKDLNDLGDEIERKWHSQEIEEVKKLTARLDERLTWARSYFQRFWRLDRSVDEIQGILDLPRQPKHFFQKGERAHLDEHAARDKLQKRILGDKLIEERVPPRNRHKATAGTDASVANIFLVHTPGSFMPPDPVVVTTSAAAMVVHSNSPTRQEYQDFDIFPDQLREYENYNAAVNGLVLSPEIMRPLGTEGFKRSRIAAMELRQYGEDFRVSTRGANWRPIGDVPELGLKPRPTLIFRDGRVFPVVHRLNFYENDSLYGQIVRKQIEKFADVIHNTLSSPMGEITYGATVKNPELSWLAPLVFWYLHAHKVPVDGKVIVDADDVYKAPFADTAVSHLLFLGLAKQSVNFAPDRLFVTCQILRRFSDIAFVDTSLPVVISENGQTRLVNENIMDDWNTFFSQRIAKKEENFEENILDESDYAPFIYICHKVGTLMCYTAPTSAYQSIASNESGGAGHFLIPRLEVAINLERQRDSYQQNLDKMLSWLAAGHWELDYGHTQSGFDIEDGQNNLPVWLPDVTLLADQAAKFARDKLSEEVQDEIQSLIAELRRRMGKGR